MKDKERTENKFIRRMRSDYTFRTFMFSALSFLFTVAFTVYNLFLAIVYQSSWNIGIAIYYALLLCIRAYVLFSEYKFYKMNTDDKTKEQARKNIFFVQSILLFVIDIALIVPITMMVYGQKEIDYSEIPAITIAVYTAYKIISSAINYVKTRKINHLSVKILRSVNFIDALVSVLTLQYTLIMTFDEGMVDDMFVLCAVSTFAIWAFLIVISVLTIIYAVKTKKSKQET